jgi:hypothetical protein
VGGREAFLPSVLGFCFMASKAKDTKDRGGVGWAIVSEAPSCHLDNTSREGASKLPGSE